MAVKDYMHQDRAKTFKKSLRAPFYSRIMELMAVCAQHMVKPELVREMLWKHTNLCQYHIAGACPHVCCSYVHDPLFHNILADYVDAINTNIPEKKNHFSLPHALQDGAKWKRIIDLLFQQYTGLPCKDIQKLFTTAHYRECGPDLVRAKQIIRQFAMKHVRFDDTALEMSCYLLQDWSQIKRMKNWN